jgi:hypothetical protein
MKLKQALLIVFLFVIQISIAQFTDIINSNRPSESQSAFAVGKTVLQMEGGLSYIKEKHSLLDYKSSGYVFDFTLRYGMLREQLEFIADFSYQNDNYKIGGESTNRNAVRSSALGAKYLFYDPFKNAKEEINIYSWKANHKFNWKQFIPAVSAYGGMNLNFTNNPFFPADEKIAIVSPKLMLITQNIFGNGYVFITNIYIDRLSTPRQSIGYVVTLTKGLNDKWSAFFENKGIKGDFYSDSIFSGGAAYLLSNSMQIDFSLSKNYKDTPSVLYGGFGLSWRNASKYEDVLIRAKKDDKKKDKSKKGKEKAKAKKRLDEVELDKP